MCDYCENGKKLTKDNFQETYIQKGLFGYSIVNEFGYNKEFCINSGMINFCPMCGKKIKR